MSAERLLSFPLHLSSRTDSPIREPRQRPDEPFLVKYIWPLLFLFIFVFLGCVVALLLPRGYCMDVAVEAGGQRVVRVDGAWVRKVEVEKAVGVMMRVFYVEPLKVVRRRRIFQEVLDVHDLDVKRVWLVQGSILTFDLVFDDSVSFLVLKSEVAFENWKVWKFARPDQLLYRFEGRQARGSLTVPEDEEYFLVLYKRQNVKSRGKIDIDLQYFEYQKEGRILERNLTSTSTVKLLERDVWLLFSFLLPFDEGFNETQRRLVRLATYTRWSYYWFYWISGTLSMVIFVGCLLAFCVCVFGMVAHYFREEGESDSEEEEEVLPLYRRNEWSDDVERAPSYKSVNSFEDENDERRPLLPPGYNDLV